MNATQVPHSEPAERGLLGGLLTYRDVQPITFSEVSEQDFYLTRHRIIYAAMRRAYDVYSAVNLQTVEEMLRAGKNYDDIGGMGYLLTLVNETASARDLPVYRAMVKAAATRRALLQAADAVRAAALNETVDTDHALAQAVAAVNAAARTRRNRDTPTLPDTMNTLMDDIEYRMTNEALPGLTTGLRDLDQMTSGVFSGQLVIVAARPGMGKSALMMNMAVAQAKAGFPVGFVSLEMPAEQLAARIMAMHTGLNASAILTAKLNSDEYRKVLEAAPVVSRLPIYFDCNPNHTPASVKTAALQWQANGIRALYVDYLGLLKSGAGKLDEGDKRVQQISEITREFKKMAAELRMPLIVASQLNREVQSRTDKRPMLSDLRDSGSIEQDADMVLMIYREIMDNPIADPSLAEIIIRKHRNGPTGTVTAYWEAGQTLFRNARV